MSENGWAEYSKLVLKELETLSTGIESLKIEMHDIKQDIALLRDREDRVTELRQWKDKIDEVVSPSQMKYAMRELEGLKTFKTKAVTIFMVVQFAMAVAVLISRFI